MIRRIGALSAYLFRDLLTSISGVLYIVSIVPILVWFFPFSQPSPDVSYFTTLIAIYGAAVTFLVTLSTASRANRAASYPFFVRLPSRVEYLAAVLVGALAFGLMVQLLLALIVLLQPGGPDLGFGRIIELPPIWLSLNLFMAVLAVHATDFVMSNWSRVIVFGTLTILLFIQSINARTLFWISEMLRNLSQFFARQGFLSLTGWFANAANWVTSSGEGFFGQVVGFVFWPFRAISEGVRSGSFDSAQALAPAVLILYATILFMVAADLFANKDLQLVE